MRCLAPPARSPDPTAAGTVVVVAGGGAFDAAALEAVPSDALVIGADSGVGSALAAGLEVHHAVGDFDSLPPEQLAGLHERAVTVHRHPVDKDATDLELALELACELGGTRLVVLGGWGDRLDHLLGEAALLAGDRWAACAVEAWLGPAHLLVVRGAAELHGAVGETVSLLATGGAARGVRTSGLRFALHGETLPVGSTRGLSNELSATRATVHLDEGVLLAIRPGTGAAPVRAERASRQH